MHADYTEEIAVLKQHLSENPESMLFARMAERYLQMDDVQQAIGICEQGLDHHPNYASGYFVLAKCYYKQQQFNEAERRLKKAIFLDPKFLMAHKLYGDLMTKIGWQKSSETSYRKILEIDPLDENVKGLLSSIPKGEQAPEIAEPILEKSVEPHLPIVDSLPEEPAKDLLLDEPLIAKPEPEIEPPVTRDVSVPQSLFEEDSFVSSPLDEEDLLPDLDEQATSKYTNEGFAQEEMRFSEILDDLFSASILEEERKEAEVRNVLEKAAESESAGLDASELEAARKIIIEQRSEIPSDEEILEATKIYIPDVEEEETPIDALKPEGPVDILSNLSAPVTDVLEGETHDRTESGPAKDKITNEPPEMAPMELEEDAPFIPNDSFVSPASEETFEVPNFDAIPENDIDDQTEDFSSFLTALDEKESVEEKFDLEQTTLERQPEPQLFEEPEEEQEEEPFTQMSAESEEEDKMMPGTHVDLSRPKEKFVTPTLGEIYAAQGQYAKAINVFELLLKKHPDNEWYKTKLDYLKNRLTEEEN